MRGTATALALLLALAAYAQVPPESVPAPPAQAPAPSPGDTTAAETPPPSTGMQPPAQQAPEPHEPAAPHPSAPRPASAHPPAAPPLTAPAAAEHGDEVAALRAEVSRLQSALDAERAAAAPALVEESTVLPEAARGSWVWPVAAAVLALAAGFALGWRVLDRRIRRKYGGLRIY